MALLNFNTTVQAGSPSGNYSPSGTKVQPGGFAGMRPPPFTGSFQQYIAGGGTGGQMGWNNARGSRLRGVNRYRAPQQPQQPQQFGGAQQQQPQQFGGFSTGTANPMETYNPNWQGINAQREREQMQTNYTSPGQMATAYRQYGPSLAPSGPDINRQNGFYSFAQAGQPPPVQQQQPMQQQMQPQMQPQMQQQQQQQPFAGVDPRLAQNTPGRWGLSNEAQQIFQGWGGAMGGGYGYGFPTQGYQRPPSYWTSGQMPPYARF